MIFAAGSIRLAGIVLFGKAVRPVPLAAPILGSKMHPLTGVALQSVPAGIAGGKLTLPLESNKAAGFGTLADLAANRRRTGRSQAPKEKTLFFLIEIGRAHV